MTCFSSERQSDRPISDRTDDRSPNGSVCWAIIGYGNPLRGDDRAGFSVAEHLHAAGVLPPSVTILATHQLLPEFAELLSQVDRVIFVDAEPIAPAETITPAPPEPPQITLRSLISKPTDRSAAVSAAVSVAVAVPAATFPSNVDPHRSSPEGLLTLAYALYDRAPATAWLVGIPAVDFSFGEQLSSVTEAGIAQAIEWITHQITDPDPKLDHAPAIADPHA